jgi:kynurenine formamidase
VTLTAADVARFHTELSNWGRWGAEDQLGALNLITPEVRRAAAGLVRSGRTASCARPLATESAVDNDRPAAHTMLASHVDGWGADELTLASHGYATSHLDALCHVFWEGRLYNDNPAEAVGPSGASCLSVDRLADGIVTRGVLLDLPPVFGVEALEPGTAVHPEHLERAEDRQGVEVASGDLLLVRTGRWRWRERHGPWDPRQRLAGLHASCLPWLADREVAILGGDGVSDVHPSGIEGVRLPIHHVGLVAMGLHLLDNLDLETLVVACDDEERWAFLITVAPLVLVGGTASPVNPIALF